MTKILEDEAEKKKLAKAVGKYNCRDTAKAHFPLIQKYVGKMQQQGLKAKSAGILIANVNYPVGKKLADMFMPGYDWQKIRNRGEVPYACSVVLREGFTENLSMFDVEAGEKLRTMEDIPVIVFDHDTVEVFPLHEVKEFVDGRSGAN